MNPHASDPDIDGLIEAELGGAIAAFDPPEGHKRIVWERIARAAVERFSPVPPAAARRRRVAAGLAAAALLVVGSALWGPWTGHGSSSALAELQRAVARTEEARWLHWTAHVEDGDVKYKWEAWVGVRPFQVFYRGPDGTVQHMDEKLLRTYDPSTRTITLRDARAHYDRQAAEAASATEAVSKAIAKARESGARVTKEERGGMIIYTIRWPSSSEEKAQQPSRQKYHVDRRSGRLARIEEWGGSRGSGARFYMARDVDYPNSGPRDIHSLGVPRDAKVVHATSDRSGEPSGKPDARAKPPAVREGPAQAATRPAPPAE